MPPLVCALLLLYIRGYHVYKESWEPSVSDLVTFRRHIGHAGYRGYCWGLRSQLQFLRSILLLHHPHALWQPAPQACVAGESTAFLLVLSLLARSKSVSFLGFFSRGKVKSTTAEPSESPLKFQIFVPPTDMARWSIRTGRAIGQTRQTQRVMVQLFIHRKRLKQTKDKGDVTIECYYNDGKLEDRTWN